MGQRLVITLRSNNIDIAAIYYHWSAYTISAINEAADLLAYLEDNNSSRSLRLQLIDFIEQRGGCIDGGKGSEEYKFISAMFPNEIFKEKGSRNQGLIALTQEGIKNIQRWSEGDLFIDLDTRVIKNYVYWDCEDVKEDINLLDIPAINYQLDEFSIDDIWNLKDELEAIYHSEKYCAKYNNKVYQFIA